MSHDIYTFYKRVFKKKLGHLYKSMSAHSHTSPWICPSGSTANRGQCVTKYGAWLRPALIGGEAGCGGGRGAGGEWKGGVVAAAVVGCVCGGVLL